MSTKRSNPGNRKKRLVNRRSALFSVISVVVLSGACSKPPVEKSKFLSSFSAREVIQKSLGSPESFGVSGGEASDLSGARRSYHRDDRADLRISQGDEPSFLQRLKEHIEQQIQVTGCKLTGGGSAEGHYSISYTDGSVQGWIDIWGLRGIGDNYLLAITVTEI